MRESLTVLAILLIIVFTAALVGPYFVDWNGQRAFIEARLSEALGETVKIRGGIDLKLLPSPYLLVDHVEVADATAPVGFSAEGVRLEMAPAPLLHGEIDFIEARLLKPHLRMTLAPDGSLLQPAAASLPAKLRFERISVDDGSLTLEDPANRRSFALEGLTLSAQASSLVGPFKGDGSVAIGGQPTGFRFSTGAREGDRLRFKLILDESKKSPRADVDGALVFAAPGARTPSPGFAGTASLSGRWSGPAGADISLPWRLAAALHGDIRKLAGDSLDLRLGDEERAVSFSGTGAIEGGKSPRASLSLKARQLDLDRVLARDDGPAPVKRVASILDALVADAGLSSLPIPVAADWTIDTISLGGETLADLSGGLQFEQDKLPVLRFEANGPGRSRIAVDGEVETGSAAGFTGHVEASAADLDKVADWLAPALPDQLRRPLPFRTFDLAGQAAVSRVGFSGRNLTLRFDRSTVSGTLAYTQAVGTERARLFADLTASALDLDGLPDTSVARAISPLDLSIRLAARAIKVERVGKGMIDAGRIKLNLTKAGDVGRIEELSVDGLGGANVRAAGTWDANGAKLDVKLDAARLQDAAELVRRLAPMPLTTFFVAQAPALSPARFSLGAEATIAAQGGLTLTSLALDGTAGATRISARVQPDPKNAGTIDGSAHLDAPDAVFLMRQLGLAVLPLPGSGAGHIGVTAHGPLDKRLDASLSASIAGTNFGFAGSLATDLVAPRLTGALKIASADISPLLQITALGFSDVTKRLPVDLAGSLDWTPAGVELRGLQGSLAATPLTGSLAYSREPKRLTGALEVDRWAFTPFAEMALGAPQPAKAGENWSNLPFTTGLVEAPTTSIAIKAKSFDLPFGYSGRDAAMRLEVGAGLVALHDFACTINSAAAAGDLTLRRDGATAAVEGHVSISDFELSLPSVRGRLSAALDLAGTGQNALALVAGLAGSGHATIADMVVPRSDPAALGRVFAAADDDRLSVDEAEVTRSLRREFDQRALSVGTRNFDLGLASGVLRFAPVPGPKPDADTSTAVSASFDLRSLGLDQRLSLDMRDLPKDWHGAPPRVDLSFKGPLSNPTASIDAAGFVNALAARAIARESARIQSYEFDIHERAFFNQRLLSERRREQQRLKAEDDARQAEADQRKAQEDAARAAQAEQRKAAEDAARAAQAEQRKAAEDALRATQLEQRKAEEDRRRAEALRLDRLKKADDARRKAEEAAPSSEPARIAPFRPPPALQSPAYTGTGDPIDPSAAGRY